jgi:hypothetical protein
MKAGGFSRTADCHRIVIWLSFNQRKPETAR